MLTLGLTMLVFAAIGGKMEVGYYVPNLGGYLKISGTTNFQVKTWSAFSGLMFGGVLGFGIAHGLGQHFYPAPYKLAVTSFTKVDGGQSYLVIEEASNYAVIIETVPAALSEITPTIGPAKVEISGRFQNPKMNLWVILPDEPHYHFFLPVDLSAPPEQKPLEPLAIATSRGALTFMKCAILSL
jgi:hypothetical protein